MQGYARRGWKVNSKVVIKILGRVSSGRSDNVAYLEKEGKSKQFQEQANVEVLLM